jgi:hypothetical protein
VIFARIDIRGRPESPLKIKEVFRDIFIRLWDIGSENCGFGPDLWGE